MKKLFEIQKMNLTVKKDARNPHFKNEYITLDSLISKLQPICNEMWLLIIHYTSDNEVITNVISIEDNSNVISKFPLWDIMNPQKVWSAITYAKRYNLCQIFNIITDRDDDGNIWSEQRKRFTANDFKRLKDKNPFKTYNDAIAAIEKKWILTDNDKESITFLFNDQWKESP